MAQVINTNVLSLNAQRNLSKTGMGLAQALQRLSSGLRINSAKDDSAGLGISDRMTTQIRGLNQAVRNSQDGISLSQTSESALAEITNNLQRIRELAVQSANATNSAADRAALDLEVQQRISEVNRIATQTSFNGRKVLDGTFGSANFQVGANIGDTITVGLSTSIQASSIGAFVSASSDTASATSAGTATATGTGNFASGAYSTAGADYLGVDGNEIGGGGTAVTINGQTVLGSANYAVSGDTYRGGDSAYAKAAALNATGISGLTATATNEQTFAGVGTGTDNLIDLGTSLVGADTFGYGLSINGVAIYDASSTGLLNSTTQSISVTDAVTAINAQQANTGVIASTDASGSLVLTAADGRNIQVNENFAFNDLGATDDSDVAVATVFSTAAVTDDGTNATAESGTLTQAAATFRGTITINSGANVSIATGGAAIGFDSTNLTVQSSLEAQSVATETGANNAIQSVDAALTSVSNLRSTFGAIQNRFESVVSNLESVAENLAAARSRILDADFAAETAALTKAQVLQQAGVAMLAQANAVPQNVLALLQ